LSAPFCRVERVTAARLRPDLLQLGQIEAGCEARVFGLRREHGVGLVDALVPPGPGGLLGVAPGEDGDTGLVVCNGEYCVAVLSQGPGVQG
jgi:hypothetical protein